ncbi:hypothetical protein MWH25_12040 [Natroniella acetigena]|uniref:hypothetical protein n=1 Tax=Natroniella acetigena TaxID=52004 RepID=UPI00200AC712|nr:hypothetical protein [Natroniella acetigena]MCK8828458.1 hypothetical protein [Natroniella acetigena]
MNVKLKEEIINLYEEKLKLLDNNYCSNCNPQIKYPLLPWHVGKDFLKNEFRIMFIGKPHRGKPGKITNGKYIDSQNLSKKLFFEKNKWAYWAYTRKIATSIFNSKIKAWNNIAITNLIKCTNTCSDGNSNDKTTFNMAQNCVENNATIFEEIQMIKPFIVVFYTWNLYRNILKDLPDYFNLIEEKTSINNRIKCGNKNIGWWDRVYKVPWTSQLKFLVVSHPGRKKKEEYTKLISNWIHE